jgi:hypothetical protein
MEALFGDDELNRILCLDGALLHEDAPQWLEIILAFLAPYSGPLDLKGTHRGQLLLHRLAALIIETRGPLRNLRIDDRLSPLDLAGILVELYGPFWHMEASAALGVSPPELNRWCTAAEPVPLLMGQMLRLAAAIGHMPTVTPLIRWLVAMVDHDADLAQAEALIAASMIEPPSDLKPDYDAGVLPEYDADGINGAEPPVDDVLRGKALMADESQTDDDQAAISRLKARLKPKHTTKSRKPKHRYTPEHGRLALGLALSALHRNRNPVTPQEYFGKPAGFDVAPLVADLHRILNDDQIAAYTACRAYLLHVGLLRLPQTARWIPEINKLLEHLRTLLARVSAKD